MFETGIIGSGSRCLGLANLHQVFQEFEKINIGRQVIPDDGHHIKEGPFSFCFSFNDQDPTGVFGQIKNQLKQTKNVKGISPGSGSNCSCIELMIIMFTLCRLFIVLRAAYKQHHSC
jgi:hypothetical protein